MQYVKLIIDSIEIDLGNFEKLPLSFVLRISDTTDAAGSAAGSSSKRAITLPPTQKNINFFEFFYKTTSAAPTAAKLKPFQLIVDGTPVLQGTAQLQEFSTKGGYYERRAQSIKVVLYGNNSDWISKIQDLLLRDLNYNDVNTVFNATAVLQGMQASVTGGDARGFGVAKFKEWNSAGQVDLSEYTPFLFVYPLLQKIFASAGYTIESTFLETENFKSLSFLTPIGDKYPAELSEDLLNVAADFASPLVVATPTAPSLEVFTLVFNNQTQTPPTANPYNTGTGIYTAPFTGFYNIDFSYTISAINGTGLSGASIEVFINGVATVAADEFAQASPTPPARISGTRVVQATAGDLIEVKLIATTLAGTTDFTISQANLKIIGEATGGWGAPLLFQYLLGDYKASDFIAGLTDIYNLRFDTDTDLQTVRIEPRNSYVYAQRTPSTVQQLQQGFYIPTTAGSNDISTKVDLNREGKVLADSSTARRMLYGYDSDGATEDRIEAADGLAIYSAAYELQNNRFKNKTKEVTVRFFAKTIHTNDAEINAGSSRAPQIPLIYPNDYREDPTAAVAEYDIAPRLLHFYAQRAVDGQITVTNIGAIDVPAWFFVNYADTTGLDPSLSFATQQGLDGVEIAGLLARYYLQQLVTLDAGRRVEDYIYWKTNDILNLSLRQMVTIFGSEFIIEEINGYNPLRTQSYNTKLLLNVQPDSADVLAIDSSSAEGLQNLANNG